MSTDVKEPRLSIDPIAAEAKRLSRFCRKLCSKSGLTEEDFKFAFTQQLHKSLETLKIEHDVKFEKNLVSSERADALYPSIIIEYKRPGKLSDANSVEKVKKQVGQYLKTIMGEHPHRRMVGVALDGQHILFVRASIDSRNDVKKKEVQLDLDGDEISTEMPFESSGRIPVSRHSLKRLLLLFRGLVKKTLAPKALVEDFGFESSIATEMLAALAKALNRNETPRVTTLYEEWRRLFGIVYGEKMGARQRRAIREIEDKLGIAEELGLRSLLFVIHTYFALLMKMIVVEVLAIQQPLTVRSYVSDWHAMKDNARLLEGLKNLESGGIFASLGITNFLEGDFFSWYVHAWNSEIAESIRKISGELNNYEPATPTLEPSVVRDLLKKLYQYLVPKGIRHDLGEYYTPDWLAQLVLDEAGYEGDPSIRVLDPACGSGTFLVEILQRISTHVRTYPEKYPDDSELLDRILQNVVGFDINPIAVLAARTNFIIALSSLHFGLGARDIQIPVYLSDSVMFPTKHMTAMDPSKEEANYRLMTSINEPFIIPPSIADREKLGIVMDILQDVISYSGNRDVFFRRLGGVLDETILEDAKEELLQLFDQIEALEREQKDRIWTRIIKNSFAPVFLDKVDLVVGNPPWINWEHLSKEYRKATDELWEFYQLLPKKGDAGKQFELGKTKRDFSMLFAYSSADVYLKEGGILAFLITQTVFKTSGGDVFRKFRIPHGSHLGVQVVHDLVQVKPFEGASNRTALIVFRKGEETQYPVDYYEWNRHGSTLPTDIDFSEARKQLDVEKKVADPALGQATNVWVTAGRDAVPGIQKVLGKSDYDAHAGITTWLNGAYFLQIEQQLPGGKLRVKNMGDVGRKKVPTRDCIVEPDLIYGLVRGRDVSKWHAEPNQYAIIPHTPDTGWRAISEEKMMVEYPESYKYFLKFKTKMDNRSGRKQLRKGHPFYILGSTGEHTFEPYKVAWGSISKSVSAAVLEPVDDPFLGRKMVIPEHSSMYLEASSWDEAHFVCAVLNSTPANVTINCFKGLGVYGNVAELVGVPRYDENNEVHKALSDLSRKAHKASRKDLPTEPIEEEVDRMVSKLWDITKEELEGIFLEAEDVQ